MEWNYAVEGKQVIKTRKTEETKYVRSTLDVISTCVTLKEKYVTLEEKTLFLKEIES
jgi:hypothetical protein